jgi:uncharacterized membrane protein YraQ (UPF0718 family)/YHS domain-containing protein
VTHVIRQILDWLGSGLREALAMAWVTFWPLVLGFTASGLVQSMIERNGLRAKLGTTSASSVSRATALGVISSSCSYAASAMARTLFARGSSFTNALIFMVASTNLVIELGLVMYFLLGWQFVIAQLAGGVIIVIGLAFATRWFFSTSREAALRAKVLGESPRPSTTTLTTRQRLRDPRYYREGARYALGDVTMLRKELLAGFIVAGFLSVHVPNEWWSHVFTQGHGNWAVLENAVVAPLVAVLSFVCSVGNIPLAAALWIHGVAFGGVISFIFADLVTFPLLLIYRRLYGRGAALRLFFLLWPLMSVAGLVVDLAFRSSRLIPSTRHAAALSGHFALGWTLVLNCLALLVALALWRLAHRHEEPIGARDPLCGMNVDLSVPVATRTRGGVTYYFCSLRCADSFDHDDGEMKSDESGDAVDPVCGMRVNSKNAQSAKGHDDVTYYFCSPGCRATFLEESSNPPGSSPITLGPKP